MPTHIRSHSRIQSILLSKATVLSPLDDGENRAEFTGHFAVMRQTVFESTKIFLDDHIDNARINVVVDH